MILSDGDIVRALHQGDIQIRPQPKMASNSSWPRIIQPASIDVRLGREFLVFVPSDHTHIDPREDNTDLMRPVWIEPRKCFVLHPHEFALGRTIEEITVSPKYAVRLEGKSSLGRLGLVIHSTAGYVDPGFEGTVTLELSNASPLPIQLWPGMPIAQLSLVLLSSPARRPYGHPDLGSKYQKQRKPVASRAHLASGDYCVAEDPSRCDLFACRHCIGDPC